MNRSVYNYNGYVDRDRSRSPSRGDSRDRGNGSRDRDNRLHRDYVPAGQGFPPPSGAGWPRTQQSHDPASNGHQSVHPAWTPPSGKPRPNGHLPQLKAYPPDRYSFHCQTCRIDKGKKFNFNKAVINILRSLYLLLSACSKRRLHATSIILFYKLPATRFYKCPETSPCSLYSEYTSTKSRNKNQTWLVFCNDYKR